MPEPAGTSRRVVLYGNPALRTKSRLIRKITADVVRLFADLKVTLLTADGVGLAANQIAETLQCFALDPRGADIDHKPYCICNPEVVATEGKVENEEGCLSLPGLYDFLKRPEFVRVKGIDEEGKETMIEATGLMARAIMHEMDHLNGVLFVDHLSPSRRRMVGGKLSEFEERERMC
jgi:peptide deformylase